MSDKLGALPVSVDELQVLIRQLEASLEKERTEKIEYQHEALKYFEEIQLLRRRIFGRRAEKLSEEDSRQLLLFNEADEILLAQSSLQPEQQTVEVRDQSRRKCGRKRLPPEIPRVETIHDFSEEEKRCGCGQQISRIGEEICEKLEVIPARIRVR